MVTKKSEDSGSGGTPVSGSVIVNTTTKVASTDFEGTLEDLVRYKFTTATGSTNWWLFRMRNPIWYDSSHLFTRMIGDAPHSGRSQWVIGDQLIVLRVVLR